MKQYSSTFILKAGSLEEAQKLHEKQKNATLTHITLWEATCCEVTGEENEYWSAFCFETSSAEDASEIHKAQTESIPGDAILQSECDTAFKNVDPDPAQLREQEAELRRLEEAQPD